MRIITRMRFPHFISCFADRKMRFGLLRTHLYASEVILSIFLLFCSVGHAQDNLIDDRGKGTINHNYFVASQSPELKALLINIEAHHLISCPHDSGGPMADIRGGKYDYAISDLQYILERFVNHPRALIMLDALAKLTKMPLLPIQYYEHALKLYPQYALTQAQYGAYLVDIGRVEGGVKRLQMALEIDPKLPLTRAWLAKAYAKSGNPELAGQSAARAKESRPRTPPSDNALELESN